VQRALVCLGRARPKRGRVAFVWLLGSGPGVAPGSQAYEARELLFLLPDTVHAFRLLKQNSIPLRSVERSYCLRLRFTTRCDMRSAISRFACVHEIATLACVRVSSSSLPSDQIQRGQRQISRWCKAQLATIVIVSAPARACALRATLIAFARAFAVD